jgi:hypothetical protein
VCGRLLEALALALARNFELGGQLRNLLSSRPSQEFAEQVLFAAE